MNPLTRRAVFLAALIPCWCAPAVSVADEDIFRFLREDMGFSGKEQARVADGRVVTRAVATDHKSEIAILGVMRVEAPRAVFAEGYGRSVPLVETFALEAMGDFGDEPDMGDVGSFALDARDVDVLRDCSPHDCDIKIAPWVLGRIREQVDWGEAGAEERLNGLVRHMVVEYVKGYMAGGNAVMGEYIDQEYALSLAAEFKALLDASPYLFALAPDFYSYLQTFPAGAPEGAEDRLFWSVEDIGANYPVSSVYHLSHATAADGRPVIAAKRIYSTHYFEASLGLTTVSEELSEDGPSFYFVYLNRSRIDSLRRGGFLSGVLRGRLEDGLEEQLRTRLKATRRALEGLYREKGSIAEVGPR